MKALNNILSRHLRSLARPHDAADRSALPVAGDDELAKAMVTAFLDSIGYDAVDAGALADSWRLEPSTPVYLTRLRRLSECLRTAVARVVAVVWPDAGCPGVSP